MVASRNRSRQVETALIVDSYGPVVYGLCWEAALHQNPQKLSIAWWPSLQDYNEAIQNPQACLRDEELKYGLPYTNAIGLPRAITGSFASVYRMRCVDKDYALRLFLRNISDQSERYALISAFIQNDDLPYTVTFDFLHQGIRSRGEWLPALKMEWVEGKSFDDYIVEHLHDSKTLGDLVASFVKMMKEMKAAGIAHGDLQHGNIIICNDELRLVDYDGMFVPAMQNFASAELGHPNYQHPGRTAHHFGPYLDNFSAWVIYASIKALQIDPLLLHQLGGGDDCLLFRKSDFNAPLQSAAFAAFEKHENEELQKLGRFVRAQLQKDVLKIPYLEIQPPAEHNIVLTPIAETISTVKEGPRLIRSDNTDWLEQENVGALQKSPFLRAEKQHLLKDSQTSWTVHAPGTQHAVWVKPAASSFSSQQLDALLVRPAGGGGGTSAATFPPGLAVAIPRKIQFDSKVGTIPPATKQWFMILNPFALYMVFSLATAITVDQDLKINGQTYDATISNVHRYESNNKYGTTQNTYVTAVFNANGKKFTVTRNMGQDMGKYRQGAVYPTRALPANPNFQEPFNDPAGSQQSTDALHGLLCLLVTFLLELFIWTKALWHRHLAKSGMPVIATLDQVFDIPSANGSSYRAEVSYDVGAKHYSKMISINQAQFHKLQQSAKEIILCDPALPHYFVLYRFCQYKPI